jgi:hypothetical protein
MNSLDRADPYLVRDILAILSILFFSVLGVGTVFHELKGTLTALVKGLQSKVKH